MQIVLAAATYNEINTTAEWLQGLDGRINRHTVTVLITGIGGTIAACRLTTRILSNAPALVIQAGIAGSFTEDVPIGNTVLVKDEVFADLGALEDEVITDIFDMGLAGYNDSPFTDGVLVNPYQQEWSGEALTWVKGATVNCISSTLHQADLVKAKYRVDVESMEGAALHYVCLLHEVPFIQLRSISNRAGDRDKKRWKMPEAIAALNKSLMTLLAGLK